MSWVVYERRLAFAVMGLSCLLVALATEGEVTSNPQSRLATMDALVHDHTFAIDNSVFVGTVDKVMLDGRLYSSKPPLLSVLATLPYFVLHHLFGLSFRGHTSLAVVVVTLLVSLGAHVLLLFYTWRVLSRLPLAAPARVSGLAIVALGMPLVGYATTVNNHTPAAAVLMAAFYYAHRTRHEPEPRGRDFALAGLFAALLPTFEFPPLFVSVAVALYLLAADWRRTVRFFVPAALVPLAAHFFITYLETGSVLPIYLRRELYRYPGSYWNHPIDMDALDEPKFVYAFHMLFGHHGLIAMTPVLVLGIYKATRAILTRDEGALGRREALLVLVPLALLVLFYIGTTNNYGGACIGFRWLSFMTPLLAVFTAQALRPWPSPRVQAVLALAFLVGALNGVDALRDPWTTSRWQSLLARLGIESVPRSVDLVASPES